MTASCFANSTNNFDATCAPDSYQGEPALASDVTGGKLIGAQNDIYPGACSASAAAGAVGDCGLSATVSTNGTTWQRFKLSRTWGGHNFLIGFDPSATVDSQGRYFVAYGVSDSSGPNGIVVVSSADGGLTWKKTNPVVLNLSGGQFEDKYWITADTNSSSSFKDRLYIAWDRNKGNNQILMVSYSGNQGQSWSAPKKINDGTSSLERVIYAFPAVAPNGNVHVLWHDYARRQIFIDKSTDGGGTWGTDVAVASTNIGFGVDIGCNGGRSMTPAPQMAIDASGNIYVVFAKDDAAAGLNLDVFFTKSINGGASWSTPMPVSSTSAGHQYNPAIAIDSTGAINVSYLDRRDDAGNCRTNTYLSRSTNGGTSFSDSKVTDADSNFNGNPNGPGDYTGIATLGANAYPYFPDHRDANDDNDNVSGTIDGGFEVYSAIK
ncbi:MAG: exo-alpha-sialidase [Acidobacteria bacterium]|nr:exo-alpha-sialidase [Acidobacteriota bacterium]